MKQSLPRSAAGPARRGSETMPARSVLTPSATACRQPPPRQPWQKAAAPELRRRCVGPARSASRQARQTPPDRQTLPAHESRPPAASSTRRACSCRGFPILSSASRPIHLGVVAERPFNPTPSLSAFLAPVLNAANQFLRPKAESIEFRRPFGRSVTTWAPAINNADLVLR